MYRYNPLDGDSAKIAYDEAYFRGQKDQRAGMPPKSPYKLTDSIEKYKYFAYMDGYNGDFLERTVQNRKRKR